MDPARRCAHGARRAAAGASARARRVLPRRLPLRNNGANAGEFSVPAAYVAHRTPDRLRLRIPSRRNDGEYFTRLVAALRDAPGVEDLRVNPRTAGVLIVAAPGARIGAIALQAAGQGLFHLGEDAPLIAESVRESAERIDGGIRQMSGNQLDLRALTFVILAGGALLQLARGQWLAPATTLGWYAAALFAPGFRSGRPR